MIHRALETILLDNDCIGGNSLPENLSQRYRIALYSGTDPDTPESPPEAVFLISDKNTLLAEGESRGIFSLQILNSENLTHMSAIPPERLVFHSLHAAVDWILKHPNAREDLQKAIDKGALSLRQGKLTAFPTETVYGLGAILVRKTNRKNNAISTNLKNRLLTIFGFCTNMVFDFFFP